MRAVIVTPVLNPVDLHTPLPDLTSDQPLPINGQLLSGYFHVLVLLFTFSGFYASSFQIKDNGLENIMKKLHQQIRVWWKDSSQNTKTNIEISE